MTGLMPSSLSSVSSPFDSPATVGESLTLSVRASPGARENDVGDTESSAGVASAKFPESMGASGVVRQARRVRSASSTRPAGRGARVNAAAGYLPFAPAGLAASPTSPARRSTQWTRSR